MMTRYYSTDTKRFTSQDVVFGSISDSLSINQFIYTMNNPISFFDPWGRDRWFIDDGIDGITITSDIDLMPLGALATDWYLYLEHEDWEPDDLCPANMASDLTLKEQSRALATKSAYDVQNGVYTQIWVNAAVFYGSLAVIANYSFKGAGETVNWTGDAFDDIARSASPDDLISSLENAGWEKTIVTGGSKSGQATILKNPVTGTKVRIHATPYEGIPYFRVQNSGGGYLDSTGTFPSNATRQQLRDLTHFYFGN